MTGCSPLNIGTELAVRQHIKIVTTGGVARPQSYELSGPLAIGVLEQVTLDTAILGVDEIDTVVGATAHHEGEASINRLMGKQGRKVIIVAGIAAEDVALFEAAGIDVVIA